MDRRDFLKTTGAAAVAGSAMVPPAEAADETASAAGVAAPAVLSDARELSLASCWQADLPGFDVARLARRIEIATGGRYRIEIETGATDADLSFGLAEHPSHPAFAYFAGLPLARGLAASDLQTWLAVGGGQMLWDELAAEFGFKPLLAGHTGESAGLWANRRLDTPADLQGASVFVGGLAADVMRALGAAPVSMGPQEIKAALGDGRLAAAEWLGPLAAVSGDLQPLTERLYVSGLSPAGKGLSLNVRTSMWHGMSPADRVIFEACAAEQLNTSLTEAKAHALMAHQVAVPAKWPARQLFPRAMGDLLEQATAAAIAGLAATDPSARRIHDSHEAFRNLLGASRLA